MFCQNCGSILKDGANFCGHCGKEIIRNNYVSNVSNVQISNPTDGKATASLIIGILSVIFSFIFNILALPLPIIGLILGINSKGKGGSKTAGIVLNLISFVIIIVMFVIVLLYGIGAIKKLINA